MTVPVEQNETYTYTSSNGVVFVITDVPALVFEDNQGNKEVCLKPASSRVVNKYIREGLKLYTEPNVHSVSFEEAKQGLLIDMQVRFVGQEIGLNNSSLDTWRNLTFLLQKSYDLIKNVYKKTEGVSKVSYPTVTVGAGSLIFGLKGHHKPPLFENGLDLDNLITDEIRILQLLIDGHALANGEKFENELLLSHPQIQLEVMKAVQKLSPTGEDKIEKVQLIPKSRLFERDEMVTFTPNTHYRAKRLIGEMGSKKTTSRDVLIVGQIEVLSRKGKMTITNLEYNYPEFKNHITTAVFPSDIWEELASFFQQKGKRLLFKATEYKMVTGSWSSKPFINSVEEAPSQDKVKQAANEKIMLS